MIILKQKSCLMNTCTLFSRRRKKKKQTKTKKRKRKTNFLYKRTIITKIVNGMINVKRLLGKYMVKKIITQYFYVVFDADVMKNADIKLKQFSNKY